MKTTRKLIAMLLAVLMCFSLAACGNEAAETKDSVVIAIGSEPETLDPTQGWGHGNAPIVQSTLVRYTSDLSFENDLANHYIRCGASGREIASYAPLFCATDGGQAFMC